MNGFGNRPARLAVLFDIDGTLVRRAGPHHRQALEVAIREVTGIPATTEGVDTHGRLDPDILALMLRNSGAPERVIREAMPALLTAAEDAYLEGGPPLQHACCPGLPKFLEDLAQAGTPLGLVTGNLPRIAKEKLRRAGLDAFFSFGAFAGMAPTRGELAAMAVAEAAGKGWIGPQTVVALVGDSPNDVVAAREARVRSVAVATGLTPVEELRVLNPDLLWEDMSQITPGQLWEALR